jgi:hypothetical protein
MRCEAGVLPDKDPDYDAMVVEWTFRYLKKARENLMLGRLEACFSASLLQHNTGVAFSGLQTILPEKPER